MLKYEIEVKHADKLVFLVASGEIELHSYAEAANAVWQLVKKHKYNIFYDLYDTTIDFDVDALQQAPRSVQRDTDVAKDIYTAALVNEIDYPKWSFIELQHYSMGLTSRVFTDRDQAMGWLSHNTKL